MKADGYGHGAVPVARAALEAGADGLCVALVQEGAALRQAGIGARSSSCPSSPPTSCDELVRWRPARRPSTRPVPSTRWPREAREPAAPTVAGPPQGRHRHAPRRAPARTSSSPLVQALLAHPELRWEGLWTHLAVADEPARPDHRRRSSPRFDAALAALRARRAIAPPLVHAANSAGALA